MNFSANACDLSEFIRHRKWDAVLNHLKDYNGDATVKGGNCMLPLHWATYEHAPFEVIEELVRIDPRSINAKNNVGNLPLHFYLRYSNDQSLEIAQLLKNETAVRTANDEGELPLHAACNNHRENKNGANFHVLKSVLDDFPEATGAVDRRGHTPLHVAACCWSSVHSELLNELLKRNPSAAKVADNRGRYPLHLACDNKRFSVNMIKRVFEAYPDALNTEDKWEYFPDTRHWFKELLELNKDFDSTMRGMTVVAAGAVLESNRLKRKAESQEPEAESEFVLASKARIESLEVQNKELEQRLKERDEIIANLRDQLQSIGNNTLDLGESVESGSSK